jgi:hypothetical protein
MNQQIKLPAEENFEIRKSGGKSFREFVISRFALSCVPSVPWRQPQTVILSAVDSSRLWDAVLCALGALCASFKSDFFSPVGLKQESLPQRNRGRALDAL